MIAMVLLAIKLPSTIWWLIQIKLEILVHITPAIMSGLYFKEIFAKSVLWKIFIGVTTALLFLLTALPSKPFGFYAGTIGLLLNFLTLFMINLKDKNRLGKLNE